MVQPSPDDLTKNTGTNYQIGIHSIQTTKLGNTICFISKFLVYLQFTLLNVISNFQPVS